ncbi:MAG: fluoride efflux transporter CrcB [SAR324 cluster bacterium]|jgi:CrcB protein|nr:fluoride efflux transporter CrcB [SAR324 cluster bacterium]|tara:strand:+ start:188 stop:568 length:381 start_codon:yes stop_codon:yes gene_type:complete
MSELTFLAIAFGGGFGSVSRFILSREMGLRLGDFLPYGTLAVNVIGSLALGWLATIFLDRPEINGALRLGITVGFLGAFTTFSTFSLESVQLLLSGAVWRAVLNVAVNTVVCLGMCYLGIQLARLN